MTDPLLTPRRHDRQMLDPRDILALIDAADSCRLGLVDCRRPVPLPCIVALSFGYQRGGDDWLRGASGSMVQARAGKLNCCVVGQVLVCNSTSMTRRSKKCLQLRMGDDVRIRVCTRHGEAGRARG